MAIIKSGDSSDLLSVDQLSKAARVTLYDTAGNANPPINASISGVTKKELDVEVVGTDIGLVVNSVVHGLSSAGGGTYVDMKVTPSGAVVVDGSGNTQPVSGSVSVSNFPATQPVSGSVSVSNFPATQPVSGTVAVSNFPGTQPVSATSLPLPSGASTEATLALIKAKTDNLDVLLSTRTKPADTQTISGSVFVSNFPGTQPVSGTVTANQGTGGASAWKVDGSAVTQPVSGSVSVSNFPASTEIANDVGNPIPTTAADVLTKGTQGATGFSVQELKDAGRSIKTYSALAIAGVATEAMISLTPQTDGTAGSAGTSFTVTAGKRLRLQSLVCSARTGAAAANWSRFVLRMSSSGAVTTASPILAIVEMPAPAAVLGVGSPPAPVSLADGIDLTGTMQFGVSHIALATTNVESVSITAFEY